MFVQVTRNNTYLTFGQYSKLSHLDLIVGHKIFHKYLIILQHEHNTLFVLLSIKIFSFIIIQYIQYTTNQAQGSKKIFISVCLGTDIYAHVQYECNENQKIIFKIHNNDQVFTTISKINPYLMLIGHICLTDLKLGSPPQVYQVRCQNAGFLLVDCFSRH